VDISLVMLNLFFVGAIAFGMYLEWFGLWVSKENMQKQIDAATIRRQELPKQIGDHAADRC